MEKLWRAAYLGLYRSRGSSSLAAMLYVGHAPFGRERERPEAAAERGRRAFGLADDEAVALLHLAGAHYFEGVGGQVHQHVIGIGLRNGLPASA